jgi:hypothetical protein
LDERNNQLKIMGD